MMTLIYSSMLVFLGAANLPTNAPGADFLGNSREDLDLISTILKHNRASLQRITSVRFEQEWETIARREDIGVPDGPPPGLQSDKRRGTYLGKGKWFRYDYTCVTEVAERGYHKERRRQGLLNDKHLATVLTDGSAMIQLWEHGSIEDMRPFERTRAKLDRCVCALDYVSAETYDFPARLESPGVKWTVSQELVNGSKCYVIKSESKKLGKASYTFDAEKDFLLTAVEAVDARGKPDLRAENQLSSANGIWYPNKVINKYFSDGSEFNLSVTKADLNIDLPDDEFQFSKLVFDPEKASMSYESESDSKPRKMVFRDGKWVPRDLFDGQTKRMRP